MPDESHEYEMDYPEQPFFLPKVWTRKRGLQPSQTMTGWGGIAVDVSRQNYFQESGGFLRPVVIVAVDPKESVYRSLSKTYWSKIQEKLKEEPEEIFEGPSGSREKINEGILDRIEKLEKVKWVPYSEDIEPEYFEY